MAFGSPAMPAVDAEAAGATQNVVGLQKVRPPGMYNLPSTHVRGSDRASSHNRTAGLRRFELHSLAAPASCAVHTQHVVTVTTAPWACRRAAHRCHATQQRRVTATQQRRVTATQQRRVTATQHPLEQICHRILVQPPRARAVSLAGSFLVRRGSLVAHPDPTVAARPPYSLMTRSTGDPVLEIDRHALTLAAGMRLPT